MEEVRVGVGYNNKGRQMTRRDARKESSWVGGGKGTKETRPTYYWPGSLWRELYIPCWSERE